MENQELNAEQNNVNLLTATVKNYLIVTSSWGKFLAILGYIGLGLLLILSLMMLFGMSFLNDSLGTLSYFNQPQAISLVSMGIIYLIMIALYFFPVYFLHQFSKRVKSALLNNDISDMETAFKNLKSLFKFTGVVSIVVLSIYVLLLLIVVPMAIFMS